MTTERQLAIYTSLIGAMIDVLYDEPSETTVEDIDHAMQILGLDPHRLLIELTMIEAIQEVCKAFTAIQITSETLVRIGEGYAEDVHNPE